jgi:hypothetical protein
VALSDDMIKKTEQEAAIRLDPLVDQPKLLLSKILILRGIEYPQETFQLAMSEQTRLVVDNQRECTRRAVVKR